MGALEGKVALVSGGARGMGAAAVRRFAAEGASVLVGDVLDDVGEALAKSIGAAARYLHLDVTSEEDWAAAVGTATDGVGRLDVLVNNAGIGKMTPIIGGSLSDYMDVVNVNQVGVYLGMKAGAAVMAEGGGGSIVNISSIDGIIGMPGVAGYVASKFAVRGMTKVAALELAPLGIRCNSVHPGYIDTAMLRGAEHAREMTDAALANFGRTAVPIGRLGAADEVAEVVLFLASDASRYCTGSEFVVDGGVIAGINPAMG
ncbi:MAG: SDR family oxidoreductase [Acidimicrobiales bacterium]